MRPRIARNSSSRNSLPGKVTLIWFDGFGGMEVMMIGEMGDRFYAV